MPNWTPEQTIAIEKTGCDLLVSASAGTGKTAVLVERVVRLALDGPAPADLDRFLIVTFTEAAASEMREKIAAALRERAARAAPSNPRARRQAMLLDKAQISTLHAFCNTLLRRHFHRLGLDPAFAILDQDEARLLRSETAQTLFETEFQNADPRFLHWLDAFGGANPETAARKRLLELHAFIRTLDDAPGWARRVRSEYPLAADGSGQRQPFDAHAWFPEWRDAFLETLERFRSDTQAVRRQTDGLPRYAEWIGVFHETLETARRAAAANDWTGAIDALRAFAPARLPALKKAEKSPTAEHIKDQMSRLIQKAFPAEFLEELASMTPDEALRAHAHAAPDIHLLLDLADRFETVYAQAKHRRSGLDFNDLEQFALRLLRDDDNPEAPSEIARLCRELYEYVLVDEYQDINPVQDAILRLVSRDGDQRDSRPRPRNLFAVGDVKQSIYAFRLAAPEIFLEKYDAFPQASETPQTQARVDLTHNFRSRSGVLRAANRVFERVMTRRAAGLDYGPSAALRPGATFPPRDENGHPDPLPIEFHAIEKAPETDEPAEETPETDSSLETAQEREAYVVGQRILEMTGRLPGAKRPPLRVFDSALGVMRTAAFRDIIILLRSMRGRAETYASVLNQLGVPTVADLGAGFFAAPEVRDTLNLLRLIDNPLQDIPLASVLRSPFENWTETDLARLRVARPGGFFHEAAREASSAAPFFARLDGWRTRARQGALADLVAGILDETDYAARALAQGAGQDALANLERLHALAAEFDAFSRQGLARFLRFIDQLRQEETDFGAASPLGESQDATRLLSIHKSKGLEFPIVFLPGLATEFNFRDLKTPLLLSRRQGMALQVADLERHVRYPTPGLLAMRRSRRREQIAEEMRILYVAMTRAREHLVLSASIENAGSRDFSAAPTAPEMARRPLDWVGAALAEPDDSFEIKIHDADEIRDWRPLASRGIPGPETDAGAGASLAEPGKSSEEKVAQTIERLRWRYPHAALVEHPARLSVSELKRRLDGSDEAGERSRRLAGHFDGFDLQTTLEDAAFSDSAFREAATAPDAPPSAPTPLTAAERGTLTHLAIQHLDLLRRPLDYGDVSAQIDRMIDRNLVSEDQRAGIDIEAIAQFFDSPLGRRLLARPASSVWRETPFILGLTPSEAGMEGLDAYDSNERVRVQGIIDCLFEEDGRLILIDFKTDVIPPSALAARVARHQAQMRLYAHAVRAIFPQPLSETHLYFLALGRSELLSFD